MELKPVQKYNNFSISTNIMQTILLSLVIVIAILSIRQDIKRYHA